MCRTTCTVAATSNVAAAENQQVGDTVKIPKEKGAFADVGGEGNLAQEIINVRNIEEPRACQTHPLKLVRPWGRWDSK